MTELEYVMVRNLTNLKDGLAALESLRFPEDSLERSEIWLMVVRLREMSLTLHRQVESMIQ